MRRLLQMIAFVSLVLLLALTLSAPVIAQTTTTAQQAIWVGTFYDTRTPGEGDTDTATYTGLNRSFPNRPTDANGNTLDIPEDNWSARFTTTAFFTSGFWEFQVLADDGVRVLVNGNTIIDALDNTGQTTRSNVVNLTGGTFNVVVELVDRTGGAFIQINWFSSTGTPSSSSVSTAVPVLFGNVSGVNGLAVRTGPFLGASLVAVARPGKEYPILARNTQEGLFTWYRIQFDEDTVGWSSGRYLRLTEGSSDSVPLDNDTVFDNTDDPPGRVVGVTRSVMNFRVHPSPRSERVAAVPQLFWGAEVEIIARTIQGGQNFWYQVLYTPEDSDTTYAGWIYAPFVGIAAGSDPLDSVPVR